MRVHALKTGPNEYQAVSRGVKTFELRFNDRNYAVGDLLILKETEFSGEEMKAGKPLIYTGREVEVVVTHILRGPAFGLMPGWVNMSIKLLESPILHSAPIASHWRVEVSASGELIVAIESGMLAGRDLSENDLATIRNCAEHLWAFVAG